MKKDSYDWVKKLNPSIKERLARFFQRLLDWWVLPDKKQPKRKSR